MSSQDPQADHPQVFAHPAEEMFARILDFYGLEWHYEPRTFELERDAKGRVTLAFTPDFYLPEQDLYIELTTLRAKLMKVKHRKIRRMRELYPETRLVVGQSLGGGYFYSWHGPTPLTERGVDVS